MRVLLFIAVSAAAIAAAFATGALRPGLTTETLQDHAERSVLGCLHHAGFHGRDALRASLGEEQAETPHFRALERCWSQAANDERFARLALVDPIAHRVRLRATGFKAWRCAERAGYRRTTDIPLSGPHGYPLRLAAGNFRVGPGPRRLEAFYRTAARCTGEELETFRWADGTFSREPADGVRECVHHDHNGSGSHAHGCYGVPEYPTASGGA